MVQKMNTAKQNAPLKYFKVEVMFDNDEECDGPFSIPNGIWHGWAKNKVAAQALAYNHCWDDRLDTTCCYPVYVTKQVPGPTRSQ